jgi:hypothetical protein
LVILGRDKVEPFVSRAFCIETTMKNDPKPPKPPKPAKQSKPPTPTPTAAKHYPVPEWMDADLKPTAAKLDLLARHQMAETLERQAAQLREFSPPPVACVAQATVGLRPKMKAAVLYFVDTHGGAGWPDEVKLAVGIRWVLEAVLPKIELVSEFTCRQVNYRIAEGLEDSAFSEKLIGDALENWHAKRQAETNADEAA